MLAQVAPYLALALALPGIAMAFIPMLPALSYMFVVALVFAIFDGFATLTSNELLILFGFVAISFIIDHSAGLLGAKYGGAHAKSLLWGILGSLIGTFTFPPVGTFIGLFVAVFIAEMYYKKNHGGALKAAGGALIGTVIGVIVNIILAIAFTIFLGLFIFL
jgi:uncharacterized protein